MIAISIVEDIDDVRNSLQRLIESASGFLCLSTYSNAEDALKDLPQINPDVVLMDINLPGMSGIECIKKVKVLAPQIQFLMFTIYEDSEQVFDALTAGASGYLLKKTPKERILEALKELHQGGSPMSAHIARKVVSYFQREKEIKNTEALLSPREKEVLELLSKGFLYKEVGDRLNIAPAHS
jgi:DNA-binding NarL/FixJ family response regulator